MIDLAAVASAFPELAQLAPLAAPSGQKEVLAATGWENHSKQYARRIPGRTRPTRGTMKILREISPLR